MGSQLNTVEGVDENDDVDMKPNVHHFAANPPSPVAETKPLAIAVDIDATPRLPIDADVDHNECQLDGDELESVKPLQPHYATGKRNEAATDFVFVAPSSDVKPELENTGVDVTPAGHHSNHSSNHDHISNDIHDLPINLPFPVLTNLSKPMATPGFANDKLAGLSATSTTSNQNHGSTASNQNHGATASNQNHGATTSTKNAAHLKCPASACFSRNLNHTYSTKEQLEEHLKLHNRPSKGSRSYYSCGLCPRTGAAAVFFANEIQKWRHYKTVHDGGKREKREKICEICGRILRKKSGSTKLEKLWAVHMATHDPARGEFLCEMGCKTYHKTAGDRASHHKLVHTVGAWNVKFAPDFDIQYEERQRMKPKSAYVVKIARRSHWCHDCKILVITRAIPKHGRVHDRTIGGGKWWCDRCYTFFATEREKCDHMRKKTKDKNRDCQFYRRFDFDGNLTIRTLVHGVRMIKEIAKDATQEEAEETRYRVMEEGEELKK